MNFIKLKLNLSNAVLGLSTILVFLYPFVSLAQLQVSHLNDITHLEVPGITAADYELAIEKDYVELKFPSLDMKALQSLKGYSDLFVKKVQISPDKSLSGFVVKIFTNGSNVKVFDYLTDAPVSLSIDLYTEDTDDVAEEKVAVKKPVKKNKEEVQKKKGITEYVDPNSLQNNRQPSSSEFVKINANMDQKSKKAKELSEEEILGAVKDESYDILDFDINKIKFKLDSIIESRGKIFLKFPILLSESKDVNEMLEKRVSYKMTKKEDAESKEALLLKRTFSAGNFKKFLVAKKNFLRKYPKTKYQQMLTYMEADALFRLSEMENSKVFLQRALAMYDSLVVKYPKSPLTERTVLFSAFIRINNGDYLGAIKSFKYYLSEFTESPLKPQIQMFMAQNLVRVKSHKDAIEIFENLIEHGDTEAKKDAYFYIGDAHFDRKDYKRAIQAYNYAISKYPEAKFNYPNAIFNKGEAEFIEQEFKNSLESYKAFLDNYPRHNYRPYALTRIGEIFDIIGEDEKYWRGFYNESYFRYRNTIAGSIAKAHLLSYDLEGIEGRRLPLVIQQIKENQAKITLPQADEFIRFKVSDAYFNRKKYKDATDVLISFFKDVNVPVFENKFLRRIGRGISYQIRDYLSQDKPIEALKVFEAYDAHWLNRSERIDFGLLKAMAFEKTKLYSSAEKHYREYLDHLEKLPSQDEVIAFENLPKTSLVYLRMAHTLILDKKPESAAPYLKLVKEEDLSNSEKNELYFTKALVAKSMGLNKEALSLADKINPKTNESIMLKLDCYEDQKNLKQAVSEINNYLENNKINADTRYQLLKKKSSYLKTIGNSNQYNTFLQSLYNEYKDTKYAFDEEKYRLGKSLLVAGKSEEAKSVWASINDNTIWKKMSNEALKEKKWDTQYQRYIERIPAMTDAGGN